VDKDPAIALKRSGCYTNAAVRLTVLVYFNPYSILKQALKRTWSVRLKSRPIPGVSVDDCS